MKIPFKNNKDEHFFKATTPTRQRQSFRTPPRERPQVRPDAPRHSRYSARFSMALRSEKRSFELEEMGTPNETLS